MFTGEVELIYEDNTMTEEQIRHFRGILRNPLEFYKFDDRGRPTYLF